MVEVLESYFNDEGLKRNQFLMKQLQTNPEGIPLKKIASMRRVKVESLALIRRAGIIEHDSRPREKPLSNFEPYLTVFYFSGLDPWFVNSRLGRPP